ncbi:deoxyribodipyrimidine photolyase [Marivivens niveibacter]|uniref:Deoxyribodipyrimidine photolyase n=1 Tax=Marivivens niveibacter TaxID=1930667 RepID=A0A251X2V5_9RHOB|nr:deoxyribodipyrimidine photo-lyase [Marivivens niveibacter]OUD10942.1 deoxyribodipyrimidine photolyase [Marivivens niveibacter]
MSDTSAIIVWFRRDLRLSDHEALSAAVSTGRPIIPVFIRDDIVDATGAAAKMRWGQSIQALQKQLEKLDSRLILRSGDALDVLQSLIKETHAGAVYWSRLYDPACKERDTKVKSTLKDQGVEAQSYTGHLLFEPWTVETKSGGFYRVYSPMWKAVRDLPVADCIAAPSSLKSPDEWPSSEDLSDWNMTAAMRRGAEIVTQHQCVGEVCARERLDDFIEQKVDDYKNLRDFPAIDAVSGLSENLTYGEIAPRAMWHAGWRAMENGSNGAEHFLKEIAWREFAYHLLHHTPEILDRSWREEWDKFPWSTDEDGDDVKAWKMGRTGEPFVDAAMRQMYVTGTMHNRARMIVASYLTKHLMVHWKIGMKWFEDCLTDWDPASNAMGWQWVAGSGPDAAPYFRVFNPETQLDKFDKNGDYRAAWIAEGYDKPSQTALSYFDAVPKSWELNPDMRYPQRIIELAKGRERALAAYEAREK